MSSRRARISIKPNVSRGARGSVVPPAVPASASLFTSAVDGEVTSAKTQSDNSKVNESEGNVKVKESNVKVKECEGNVKVDASEDNIKFKESEGKVNEGNVKVKECESNVTVNESQSVNEPNTAPVVKDPEMPKKPPARRAKIQVRPSLTRKPRQAAATTASAEKESSIATASPHNCDTTSAGDNVTASSHDIDEVLPDNIITPSSSLGIVSPPPPPPQQKSNIACSQKLPDEGQIKGSSSDLSASNLVSHVAPPTEEVAHTEGTEAELVKTRQFKPKTKPNIAEAGRARMRRLSESLDLSPLSPYSRRHRHPSTSISIDPSTSSIKVVPLASVGSTQPTSAEMETDSLKQVQSSKELSEINLEIIEREHEELIASGELEEKPKPRKTRKPSRRVIKSDQAPDTGTMTVKDLLYYQPMSNPLPQRENKTAAKRREKPAAESDTLSQQQEKTSEVSADNAAANQNPDNDELAPQLTIGEDGQIVVDEQSLIIENQEEPTEYVDVVDSDRVTTYTSFRSRKPTKFWTQYETRQFYKALSSIGTDFSLMCQLFPNRNRSELKRKFKREEKMNPAKIELALSGKLNFEVEPFPEEEVVPQETKKKGKPKKEDNRKRRGGSMYRTYYDLENVNKFKQDMTEKRRYGVTTGLSRDASAMQFPPVKMRRAGVEDVPLAPSSKQLMLADPVNNNFSTENSQLTVPEPSMRPPPVAIIPANTKPIPAISTLLNQDEQINQRITNFVVSGGGSTFTTSNSELVTLTPLYKLSTGEKVMVRTQKVADSDRKVHHLYLYTPPQPDGTGNSAKPLTSPITVPNLTNFLNTLPQILEAGQSSSSTQNHMPVINESDTSSEPSQPIAAPVTSESVPSQLTRLTTPSPVKPNRSLESHNVGSISKDLGYSCSLPTSSLYSEPSLRGKILSICDM